MKILVTSLPDIQRIPVQRPHQLLHHLAEKHEVSVRCVQSFRELPRQDPFIEKLMQRMDFRYLTDGTHHPALQELSWAFGSAVHRELSAGNYDIHLNLNSLIGGSRVAELLLERGTPTMLDVGDDLPEIFAENSRFPSWISGLIPPVSTWMLQRSIRSAAALTYITQTIAKKYHFPSEKSTWMPNGVDCSLFHPTTGTLFRENLGIPDEDFLCGMIAHLNRWVDLRTPFLALRKLQGQGRTVKMLVVGGGECLPYFQRMTKILRIEDLVTFTGPVTYDRGPPLIQAMDLCMLCRKPTPASHASLPMKIFEYMACGKPVLATPLAGVKETFGERVSYAATCDEVASAISHLMKHLDTAAANGVANREFVASEYSWEHIFSRFDRVLEGVVTRATAQ